MIATGPGSVWFIDNEERRSCDNCGQDFIPYNYPLGRDLCLECGFNKEKQIRAISGAKANASHLIWKRKQYERVKKELEELEKKVESEKHLLS
jgi:ribosomal protein L37E